MSLDRILATDPAPELIAESGLAVQQWEIALAERDGRRSGEVWPSRPLVSFGAWLANSWKELQPTFAAEHDRSLLSPGQTLRLWRQVIDESDEARMLLSTDGMAALAQEARHRLHTHGLDPSTETPNGWGGDADTFLRWNRRFSEHLDENGWIDQGSLLYRFNRLPLAMMPAPIVWLDPAPMLPERRKLAIRWREQGASCRSYVSAGHRAQRRAVLAPDPSAELELAITWAQARLADDPGQRLAIVIPDLGQRLAEVESTVTERIGDAAVSIDRQRSIRDLGIFGAATTALEALQPGNDFGPIGRLLRSPFFAMASHEETAQREALERWLRRDPRTGSDFIQAYSAFGLREEFARRAPELGRRLDLALEQLPRRATPTAWAQALQASLRILGWQGYERDLPDALTRAWDGVWSRFAELTAIVGTVDLSTALGEFARVVAGQSAYRPLSLHGVHIVSRIQDVGPAYSGAWITGFSDLSWPAPEPLNPLVPRPVRRRCGMPGTEPSRDLEVARMLLDRLLQRVPEAIFSCPEKVLDQPQLPNPHISGWQQSSVQLGSARSKASARIGRRAWERVIDTAPPVLSRSIPGGPRTLDLQARNPVLAFCMARLEIQALRSPVRGLDGRRRGILVHRILELLGRAADSGNPPEAGLTAAMASAFAELPPGDAAWRAQVAAERMRLAEQLAELIALEQQRPPFRTRETELRIDVEIDGRRLRCRIDRLDELESGQVLIVDYKTGKRPAGSWFSERLSDCQLPLYAQHYRESIAGIAVLALSEAGIEYRAAGTCARDLPGRHKLLDSAAWHEQLDRWHEQIGLLIEEFVAGDVRVSTDMSDREALAFAALTRIREQLG
jgi:ATP-dependent helicase/nuclease subunit B